MELEKLLHEVKQELKEIGDQGLNASNLETLGKLADIYKDLTKAEHLGGMQDMKNYRGGDYGAYNERRYNEYGNDYGRQYRTGGGGYNGNDSRIREHMNRIMEGVEQYEYGRERYQHGGSEERILDGLEKLMYSICMFVESTYEFAQSPQEKEIIRKHLHKLKSM